MSKNSGLASAFSVLVVLGLLLVLVNKLWLWGGAMETLGGLLTQSQLLPLLLMAVALGTDAMSLSIGIGLRGVSTRDVLRISSVVGIFHVLMPLLGIVLGHLFGLLVGEIARWLGALIVAFIGGRMIWGCLGRKECLATNWVLTGMPLLLLAGSVSMDALSVGFSLGAIGYNVLVAAAVFGLFGALMTGLGLVFGDRLGNCVGDRAELVGGGVLIILAIHMLTEV